MTLRTVVLLLLILTLSAGTGSRLCAQTDEVSNSEDQLFQLPPDTPARLLRGALAAARLSQTQLANSYLQSVLDQQLSDEELQKLRSDVGLNVVLRLNANVDLQPLAGKLLDEINRAAAAAAVSPEQAESLIARLGQSRQATIQAATDLLTLGNSAAGALLAADVETQSGSLAYSLLRRHPRLFRYGILDALREAQPDQVRRGLQVLAVTADAELAPLLLEYEFAGDSPEVRSAAAAAVERLWRGDDRPRTPDAAVQWLTSESEVSLSIAADRFAEQRDLALAKAVRLAEIAVKIDAGDRDAAQAALLACRTAADAGVDAGVDAGEAPDVRDAAAEFAVRAGHGIAAAALVGPNAEILRRAMQLPEPGVRVTAAAELLGLQERVRGVSMAQQMLQDASGGSTMPEAVVIDARLDQATEAAWLLDQQGYQTARCITGQAGFERAARQLNCELILIHSNCVRWPLTQTVANLRADSRTAQTPIIVYGPKRVTLSIQQLQQQYPGVYRMSGPLSEINFADELRRSGAPGPLLSPEERSRLIEVANAAL